MRQVRWLVLVPAAMALAVGCGSAPTSNAGSPGATSTTSPVPTTAKHALTIRLLSVSDVPAGWVEVCGGAQGGGEVCGTPWHGSGAKLIGERGFQNSAHSPTETIAEEVFAFSSLGVAEADTGNPNVILGAKFAHVLVPTSFSGLSADQVAAFTPRTGSFPEDYIFVRDKTTVAVFACTGDSLSTVLSAIQAVT